MAVLGDRAYAFGGLDSGGGSTTAVSVVRGSSVRSAGRLPLAIHDAAAAPSGPGRLVVLGGGQVASYAGIAAFDPATGGVRIVGRLPTPLSDLSVATVGGTTYAVGGFTGAAWSDGIVCDRRRACPAGGEASDRASLRGGGGCRERRPDRRRPHGGGAEPRDLSLHAC